MSKFWKYFRIIFICGYRVVWVYFRYVLPYSRHPERYPIEKRYAAIRSLMLYGLKHLGLDVRLDIAKHASSPLVYVSNHTSALDPLVLIASSEAPLSFVAKKETRKLIYVGRVVRALDGIFLDRDDPFQAVRCFQLMKKRMAEGWSYCIYPEGTREKGELLGHLLPLHPGSFKIGYMAKCDFSIIATFGSSHAFSNEPYRKSYLLQAKEVAYLPYEEYKDMKTPALASLVEEKLAGPLLELVQEDVAYSRDYPKNKKPPKWWKKEAN